MKFLGWCFYLLVLMSLCAVSPAYSNQSGLIEFKSYDASRQLLFVNIVTPTVHGEVFFRSASGDIVKVEQAMLERLFELILKINCESLHSGGDLYFVGKGRPVLKAAIPAQSCSTQRVSKVEVRMIDGVCEINTNGNSLWRTAVEFSKYNSLSVYQNVYAIFLYNKSAFVGGDIHRLNKMRLSCPPGNASSVIEKNHAEQLFKESLSFKQAHQAK